MAGCVAPVSLIVAGCSYTYTARLKPLVAWLRRWQTEVKSQDEAARQRQVEERRLEMAASAQDAMEAKERNKLEKHMMAQLMREEASLVKQTTEAEAQALLDENRAMVDEIRDVGGDWEQGGARMGHEWFIVHDFNLWWIAMTIIVVSSTCAVTYVGARASPS